MIVPIVSQANVIILASRLRLTVVHEFCSSSVRRPQPSPKIHVQTVVVGHDYGVAIARSTIRVLASGPVPTLSHRQIRKRLTATNPCSSPPGMGVADENLAERDWRDRIQ